MAAIRKATLADVPEIVRMSALFYPTTHYADWCAMDEATVADLASSLIEGHIFYVAEDAGELVGMVGIFIAPFIFNRGVSAGYEVVWWVSPAARGSHVAASLLNVIEAPLRDAGVTRVQMVHMPNSPPQAAALYERVGYVRSEISYTKDI